MLALKAVWLAVYCFKVKQGSPLEAPGHGLSAVGMMLISSLDAAYWTELLEGTSNKTTSCANTMTLCLNIAMLWISSSCSLATISAKFDCSSKALYYSDYSIVRAMVSFHVYIHEDSKLFMVM